MERVQFKTTINAPKEEVWAVLWDDATYRQWTSPFSDVSYAESDWNEGSRIVFLNGEGHGMYSEIAKKVDNEFMSFKHLGSIKDGVEVPFPEEMEAWSGSLETYTLKEENGTTELTVELDMVEQYKDFFMEKFPLALAKVKELSEARN